MRTLAPPVPSSLFTAGVNPNGDHHPFAAPPISDLGTTTLNTELSWLEFNKRVVALAKDETIPLLERLRFLTISCSNLDEFFEIRFAGIKEQASAGTSKIGPDGMTPNEILAKCFPLAHDLVDDQYRVLQQNLLPELEREGIRLLKRNELTPAQREWAEQYFRENVLPILTPMGLDPAHPFPKVINKSLNLIVSLRGSDAFGRESEMAVIHVPRALPRVIRVPEPIASGPYEFLMLPSMIQNAAGELFPGMIVDGCYQFRVTRNSELWVEEEEVDDLLYAIKDELWNRNYGQEVRLEVADSCPDELATFLLSKFHLGPEDLYRVNGPVNLHRLVAMYDLVDRQDLKFSPFLPGVSNGWKPGVDIFEVLRHGDMLLHHPYQSFSPVLELVRQAAADPNVLAIKQTLYRTGTDSPMVEALVQAARSGKEVTAVVEIRARFDEEANIDLATRLQEAGANVAYGIVGYKAHAKALLVVRREGKQLRRYVHLGTGNYHARTALVYTDWSLLTCSEEIGEDTNRLFLQLTGFSKITSLQKLLHSPFSLESGLHRLINAETAAAKAGKPAKISAKMNSLSEPGIISALYRASQAGVKINLVVRGICCLRPGVEGLSENIRVISVVGRFLEHSRVFDFLAGGKHVLYCSSADWMPRNLFRRVELAFPLEDPELKKRVVQEDIEIPLAETARGWELHSDGSYHRVEPSEKGAFSSQMALLKQYADK